MPARSISVRNVSAFDIPDVEIQISKADVPLGSIKKIPNGTIPVEGITFQIFEGQYTKHIVDTIAVYDVNQDEYIEYSSYEKPQFFNLYYSAEKSLLLSEASTPITKSFLKNLANQPDVTLEYQAYHFDFQNISNRMPQTKGIRFSSEEPGVNNKSFSGDEVDINDESLVALENDEATQLIGTLDIYNKSRTIMLTQSGTLVSFTSLIDLDPKIHKYPMVSFAVSTLMFVDMI
ncbi:hypothetical protein [Leuconostoc citreum]|uniref:hypothetical protein n=1 Tax=Leuconostoc citreum TaxID=33964 RepID=UPI0021A5CC17|nr:hypothetical protein [Leuconostoc citreum]MCT3057281.1 hypothetical protein [Leuconostoc citreum]MCT3061299.1 hypothetical protein [Leuconostoc citreum]